MEVSNGSLYDGASSLAEAVLMAHRITKRKKILLSEAVHQEYRKVVQTYVDPDQQEVVLIPYGKKDGRTDEKILLNLLDGDVGAVVVQSPNFFGVIEDLRRIGKEVHQAGGLMIAVFSEAIAYGILTPPGECDADIVTGEGQSLGIPLSFGGPYLGILTTRNQHVRTMPGRLVGETVDLEGKRGFVLTLAAREQHIRREKATSNICTNEGLCALMATLYLSCLGKGGLREVAVMNLSKAEYTKKIVAKVKKCRLPFVSPTFNEFVLEIEGDPEKVLGRMQKEKIIGGLLLARFYPELNRHLLVTVTEMNTKQEIDRWGNALEKALK
jgi:glycine dehydrogenase subunit 1